jgi:hypothetical protein
MIKETLVLAALAVSSPAVVDGDTVRIAGISIRLTDYDSPELYPPKCPRERIQAEAAKAELEQLDHPSAAQARAVCDGELRTTLRGGIYRWSTVGRVHDQPRPGFALRLLDRWVSAEARLVLRRA